MQSLEVTGMDDMQVVELDLPTSFMDMLMASDDEPDADLLEHGVASDMVDSYNFCSLGMHEMCDVVRELTHANFLDTTPMSNLASVASAFGSLMFDMLVSRLNLVVAIGTFTMGILSHYVADLGREHRDLV